MNIKVEGFKTRPLTQHGDNYGSTILAVEVSIIQDINKHNLSLVAKLVPSSQFLREVFVTDISFNKEVNAYKLVSKEFEILQIENGIPLHKQFNGFPKFYGARTNREGNINEKADETAVLLLENLKESGYATGNRLVGLDLIHMKLGVRKLAQFHALSIAIKILKPNVFKETVLKASENIITGGVADCIVAEKWITSAINDVKVIPDCVQYLEKIEKILRDDMKERQNPSLISYMEPFATFVHNDFWVNNIMFKYEPQTWSKNGTSVIQIPTHVKIVDFQITLYASPIKDLIFFIYSSSADGIVDDCYDELINIYYTELVNYLKDLRCDAGSFSFDSFQKDLNINAPKEFPHILYMHKYISADQNKLPDLSSCGVDEIIQNNYGGELYEKRVKFLIKDFLQRGWL
ncbi:hypothetical protein L9F63_015442 [Diploptera punctata]|uniref:CHK kinase-like domain-containing protein n=1 Tax=Diploptera punctata TaxID=6984 RepID=A0AAD8A5K0_DIPPU|nr:hypothetical protein L9F63_015442 [Diploptera punctata]